MQPHGAQLKHIALVTKQKCTAEIHMISSRKMYFFKVRNQKQTSEYLETKTAYKVK